MKFNLKWKNQHLLLIKLTLEWRMLLPKPLPNTKKAGRSIAVWSKEENKVVIIPSSEIKVQNFNLDEI